MSSGWIVQGRVIMALILREVHTLYGSSRLGYLVGCDPDDVRHRDILGDTGDSRGAGSARHVRFDVPACGFGLWATFSETLTKCMSAVSGNKALLTFPQVTPLDLMLSRTVVVGDAAFFRMRDYRHCGLLWHIPLCLRLDRAFRRIPSDAFARARLRMLCASLAVFWPTLEKIVPMILRILFFASGIFFSVSMFPKNIADILLLNPVMQLIELLHQSLSRGYVAPTYDYLYIVAFCVVSLCLGGLLERYARKSPIFVHNIPSSPPEKVSRDVT